MRALRRRGLLTTPAPPPPPPPPPPGGGVRLAPRNASADLAAHPAYLAALEGAALMGEASDEGLTPAQAAAADAAWASFNPGAGGVGAAARPGTFVYWLYGNGLADSGPDVGVVNQDEVTFTARWARACGGWPPAAVVGRPGGWLDALGLPPPGARAGQRHELQDSRVAGSAALALLAGRGAWPGPC